MQKSEFVRRVRSCERRLYRIAHTMLRYDADCEDAVQEALLKAWKKAGSLREERYFETWLIRILINECRNIGRRKKTADAELTENIPAPQGGETPLYVALMCVESKHRIILELHYIEGYKLREIARMMSVTENTAKARLFRARKELKKQIEEETFHEANQ